MCLTLIPHYCTWPPDTPTVPAIPFMPTSPDFSNIPHSPSVPQPQPAPVNNIVVNIIDPEKADLLERVEELERRLAALEEEA